MSKSQGYLDVIKSIEFNKGVLSCANLRSFPDEVEVDEVVYILSEIGGRENKRESGENLGVYIPKDFESCLKLGTLKLRSKQAKKLAV